MRLNRNAVGALAASAMVLVGSGTALAAAGDSGDRSARCEERLAKIAGMQNVSVDDLMKGIKERVLARIDAAERAKRISSDRADKLRARVEAANLCGARKHVHVRFAARGMFGAAAEYLGLRREQLKEQLPGTSLAGLAEKTPGKNAKDLKFAMAAPGKARILGNAMIADKQKAIAKLERLVEKLATKTFPKK